MRSKTVCPHPLVTMLLLSIIASIWETNPLYLIAILCRKSVVAYQENAKRGKTDVSPSQHDQPPNAKRQKTGGYSDHITVDNVAEEELTTRTDSESDASILGALEEESESGIRMPYMPLLVWPLELQCSITADPSLADGYTYKEGSESGIRNPSTTHDSKDLENVRNGPAQTSIHTVPNQLPISLMLQRSLQSSRIADQLSNGEPTKSIVGSSSSKTIERKKNKGINCFPFRSKKSD